MSLRPQPLEPVPEDTARVARAAFPNGNPYLTLRDQLGTIFQDEDFAALFPSCGQPGLSPWRLALVTIMQFRETLADRQAAEAVRARIDWKYLLGLELTDPGLSVTVLSRVTRHASIVQWASISVCARRGECAPGGHGTASSHGDHGHGSS